MGEEEAGSGRNRESYATLHIILQSKKCKEGEVTKIAWELGLEGTEF